MVDQELNAANCPFCDTKPRYGTGGKVVICETHLCPGSVAYFAIENWNARPLRREPAVPEVAQAPWRCFHCSEVFDTAETAALHFGTHERHSPACLIDVAEYRAMEQRMEAYNDEDAEIHRMMAKLRADHDTALRREEERGYARALHDVSKGEAAQEFYRAGLEHAAMYVEHHCVDGETHAAAIMKLPLPVVQPVEQAIDACNAALEAAAVIAIRRTAIPLDALRRGTGVRDHLVIAGEQIAASIRALKSATPSGNSNAPAEPIPMTFRIYGELLRSQDNRATDQPMFIVQQKRSYVGHPDYNDTRIEWRKSGDEHQLASASHARTLEKHYQATHEKKEGWVRLAVFDIWEFVTACLTEQGCKDFLAIQGHNLNGPRIYAEGSFRNQEFRAIRNWLIKLAPVKGGTACVTL